MDLGVKYVVLDMPRPLRPAGGAAQLPGPNGDCSRLFGERGREHQTENLEATCKRRV